MVATTSSSRYSNEKVATSEAAKAFAWENPVPVNSFWDSIEYPTARSFLGNFSDEELAKLPIDPNSTADKESKLHLLLRLLGEKLAQEEAVTTPPGSLSETDHKKWYNLNAGIYSMQRELDLPEAEQTVRMLVSREVSEPDNMVTKHMLAAYLAGHGKGEEAEKTELPVLSWMEAHPKLGRDSPQAIGARRILLQALSGQGPGRRAESEKILAELNEIVDGMAGGKFEVYQEEERGAIKALIEKLGM
jgi:hypothetical protein